MILNMIKKNKTLFLISVLFIFMFGSPHIININRHGYELYNPVPVFNGYIYNLDEAHYLPGFRDVIDGHYIVKSPQLAEYKESTSYMDILPYLILGSFAKFSNAGVKEIFIISDFLLPAIGFLVFYLLLRKVFDIEKPLSILFALLISIFQCFTNFILGIFNFSSFNFTTAVDSLGQSKLYAPEFVIIFFILAIITLYYSFKRQGYLYPTLTIILGVFLVYSYVTYSTFYWTTFILLSLYTLLSNRHNLMPKIKKILFILVPSAILSLPFLFQMLQFRKLEGYPDILLRLGVEKSRFIHMPLIFAGISFVFLLIIYKVMYKKDKYKFYFSSVMLISVVIWSNLQIITGFNVQPFHWTYRISEILFFILAAYILQEGYKSLKEKQGGFTGLFSKIIKPIFGFLINKKVVLVLIIFFIIYGFGTSITSAIKTGDVATFNKNELELYDWLNENTPKDSVVLTISTDQNVKISTYAHNNVYLSNGFFSTWTTEEIIDRVVFLYDIYNVSDEELYVRLNVTNDAFRKEYLDELYKGKRFSLYDFEKYFFIYYPFTLQFFYGRWEYQQRNPDNPSWIGYYFPVKFRENLINKRHNKSYKIYTHDYLLIGPYEKQVSDVNMIRKIFKRIYSNSDFEVFII